MASFGIARAAVNTSTGNQTFTDSNMTETAQLAIFVISSATADNTLTAHNRFGMGVATSTFEGCHTMHDEDAVGTSNANRWGTTTKCIAINNTGSVGPDGEADWVSFGTGSVTINWSNAPGSAYIMTVYLFGNSSFNVDAQSVSVSGTVNTATTVTTGFDTDVVILIYPDSDLDRIDDTFARYSVGFCANDGSATQRAHNFDSTDTVGTSEMHGHFSTSGAGYSWGGNERIEVGNFTSTAYDITPRVTGAGEQCLAIAIDLGGGSFEVGDFSTPTTASKHTQTTTFTPGFVLLGLSFLSTIDTTDTSGDAGTFGLCAFTSTVENTYSWMSEDAVTTMNTNCYTNTNTCKLYQDDGATVGYEGAPEINSGNFAVDFTSGTVDATARKVMYLAMSEPSAVTTSPRLLTTLGVG